MKKLIVLTALAMAMLATLANAATLRWEKVSNTLNCTISNYKVYWMEEADSSGNPIIDPVWNDMTVGDVDSVADIITALSMILDATYQLAVSAVSDQGTEGPQSIPIRWIATDQTGEVITIPGQVKTITINFE